MKAKVKGGGLSGQLDALKYGIARALQKQDPSYRGVLKAGALAPAPPRLASLGCSRPRGRAAGLLTRDARKVERKKSGQKKARKNFTVRQPLAASLAPVPRPRANARAPLLAVGEALASLALGASSVASIYRWRSAPLRRLAHRQP